MTHDFGLSVEVVDAIKGILSEYPMNWTKVYGSRAMGTFRPNSDIDISFSIDLEDDPSGEILRRLDELSTPYKFDVTNYEMVSNEDLKDHIDRVGVNI